MPPKRAATAGGAAGPVAERQPEALVQRAAPEVRAQALPGVVLREDLPNPLFLALLGRDKHDGVAGLGPGGGLPEEIPAGVLLGREPVLGEERIGGIAAVGDQALRIPGLTRPRRRLPRAPEDRAGLVQVADAVDRRAFFQERREAVRLLGREGADRLLQRGGLQEDEAGAGREIVRQAALGWIERDAGRGGNRDRRHGGARALGHRIEGPDLLQVVAEEIEPVGLGGRHRVDVDDPAADGVVAGGLADRLGIVVEGLQLLEERLERLLPPGREREFAGGEGLPGRHGLEQRGGGGDDHQGGHLRFASARQGRLRVVLAGQGAQAGQDGQAVA